MTIDSSNSISGAGPIRPADTAGQGVSPAADAARSIGLAVVARVLGEFGLGSGVQPLASGDVYGLGALTDDIAAQLPAGESTSLGALQRAVEAFAGAVAADVAALADGLTLDRIDTVVSELPQPAQINASSVADLLEQAAARLGGGR